MKTKRLRKGCDLGRGKRRKSRTTQKRQGHHTSGTVLRETELGQTKGVTAEDMRRIAEPLCEAEGMELAYVEFQREPGGRVLRLYIDKPGGVMLEDCVYVSRQVGDVLDVELQNVGPYSLEVTSPGPNRPLGKKRDFERFRGDKAKIRFRVPQDDLNGQIANDAQKQKTVQGILQGMSEKGDVRLLVHGQTLLIPFQEITRARLVRDEI